MRLARRVVPATLLPLVVFGTLRAGAGAAPAPALSLASYAVAAQAPVVQVTQDDPTASFHPQAEGELTYTEADMDPAHAHALSASFWPGSAGANAGSLLGVLGYPPEPILNDPVRAEVSSGTGVNSANTNLGLSTMSSSVQPGPGDTQEATSETVTGANGLLGSQHSSCSLTLTTGNTLTATATSAASDISIAGIIDIGSLDSTATLRSDNGSTPSGSTALTATDVTVAGQAAYIDGTGLHAGKPGQPANPEVVGLVDSALSALGVSVVVTAAHDVPLAGSNYEYGASLLFLQESAANTITFSLGGAAVSMVVTSAPSSPTATASTPTTSAPSSPLTVPPPADVAPVATGSDALSSTTGPVESTPSESAVGPSPQASPAATPAQSAPTVRPVAVTAAMPFGVPWGWILLLGLSALIGAVLLPLIPGLLTAAAGPACARERTFTPTRRD
jgi:hypothetical protein